MSYDFSLFLTWYVELIREYVMITKYNDLKSYCSIRVLSKNAYYIVLKINFQFLYNGLCLGLISLLCKNGVKSLE